MKYIKKTVSITQNNNSNKEELRHILLEEIEITDNIRLRYSPEGIKELADTIEEVGLLEPIIVEVSSKLISPKKYRINMGHRRFLAHKQLYIKKELDSFRTILCRVKSMDEKKRTYAQLIENIQREDITHEEEEIILNRIIKELNISQSQLAKKIGKNKSYISRALKSSKIREKLSQRKIDTSNISTLALIEIEKIADHYERVATLQHANKKNISIKEIKKKQKTKKNENYYINKLKSLLSQMEKETHTRELSLKIKKLMEREEK